METIKEIKSIEITIMEDSIFKFDFNGCDEKEYNLEIQKDNALRIARALTRMANIFWEKFDIIVEEKGNEESYGKE